MVVEPFHTWPKTIKPAPEPKSGPTQEQINRWTASYAVADAGSLGAPAAPAQETADAAGRASDTRPANSVSPSTVIDTQTQLTTLGYDMGGVDGIAGQKTDQAANGLTVDGIIGPKTLAAMDAAEPAGNPSASDPAFGNAAAPPSPFQLTDPAAAAGFAEGTGVGSLINESQAIRNRTEAEEASATAALEGGMGSFINESRALHDRSEAQAPFVTTALEGGVGSLINESQARRNISETPWDGVTPIPVEGAEELRNGPVDGRSIQYFDNRAIFREQGGGVSNVHEYKWDSEQEKWVPTHSVVSGVTSDGGTYYLSHDHLDPSNDTRYVREGVDGRTPYERMQEHHDPEGNQRQYANHQLGPGGTSYTAQDYTNYPDRDAVPDVITDFYGLPTSLEGATTPGLGYAAAEAAFLGISPTSLATAGAFTALDLADEYQGSPREEGPNPDNMSPEGRPLTYEERNMIPSS